MANFVETPTRTFNAGAAIGQFRRVILSSGNLAAAAATDVELGTMEVPSFASGDKVAVRLRTAQGTQRFVAAGAITLGATVYGAASGEVGTSVNANLIGTALIAAGAQGDIVEVLRFAT